MADQRRALTSLRRSYITLTDAFSNDALTYESFYS